MCSSDAGDAVGDGDARQGSAAVKCVVPDAGDAVGNGDARQATAVTECLKPDDGDAAPVDSSWNHNRSTAGIGLRWHDYRRLRKHSCRKTNSSLRQAEEYARFVPENALSPMLVTLLPNGDARQADCS